jgi:predicted nucleic acid-binding protein
VILVDTSVWINHWRGNNTRSVEYLRSAVVDDLITGDLIVFEALAGARNEAHATILQAALLEFECVPILTLATATRGAQHYRALRSRGVTPRRVTDLWIATWCLENSARLLHDDRDFDVIAKHLPLKVITP